jgi:signal transduction histidine kinase
MWESSEEPWINMATWDSETGAAVSRIAPNEMTDPLPEFEPALVNAVHFDAGSISGRLFFVPLGIPAEELAPLADVVAREIGASFDQLNVTQRLREIAASEERIRLARDLHDGVLQTLTGAALQLQAARRNLPLAPVAAEERLSQVQRIIAAGQNDLRFFINQLGPQRAAETSGPVDLRGRVHELADRIRRQWGVPVTVATEPELLAIPDLLVSDLFLLIHEALVNAARHARASAIQLAILREAHQISIAVADDGQGFPFSGKYTLADLAREQIGPRTLRERVLSLGGTMQLETGDGGSRVRLTVPLAREVA